jgi:hypothetical protein
LTNTDTLALLLACAGPAAAENVLRFTGLQSGATTMDPHSRWDPDNRLAVVQVYEALLDIDSNLAIVPAARPGMEDPRPDALGVRAAPGGDLP